MSEALSGPGTYSFGGDRTSLLQEGEVWHLRLYVAGESAKSIEAFVNLKRLCETHLSKRYEIEIVDLLVNPGLARGDEIVAIPTLVRQLPAPMRKIIGNLSDTERVLVSLELRPPEGS